MRLPKFALAAALTVAMFGAAGFVGTGSANASDCDVYRPAVHCHYKTVTVFVEKEVAYKVKVVRYQECGTPYYTWVTKYRTIKVPVQVRVKSCY